MIIRMSAPPRFGFWHLAMLSCWICVAFEVCLAAQTPQVFDLVSTIPGPAELVEVQGTQAYLTAGKTIRVVDIADPAAPKTRGTLALLWPVFGMTAAGSTIFAANGLSGLAIIDATNPDQPALIGTVKTPGEATRVAVLGQTAAVVNRLSGLELIDVSNRTKPASVGSFYLEGYGRDVILAGSLAYAVDTSDFSVVDLSNIRQPRALSAQASGQANFIVFSPGDARGTRKNIYLLAGDVLQIYDLTDASAPKKMATYKIRGRGQYVVIQGSLAYIAAGSEGLQVLDLSNPVAPTPAGSYRTMRPASSVAVTDSLVLVTLGDGGTIVLRRRA